MAWSKEARKAYNKAYREANKEKIAESRKVYYQANKEVRKAYHKAYREANKEELAAKQRAYYEANKEKRAEYGRTYRQDNKERVASYGSRHRALKRKQIPVHLRDCPQEKQRLLQTYKLRTILTEATGVQHHVDHMWPLADGGPHWSGNLQIIPAEENLRKNASVCEATKATIIKSLYSFESTATI